MITENTISKKLLSLELPPPVYYSLFAADKLSIVCQNQSGYNWIHNNFIQLLFYKDYLKDAGIFGGRFFKSQYMCIWPIDTFKLGYHGLNLLVEEFPVNDHFMELTRDTLIDQVIAWIDKNFYLIANIDVSKLTTTHYFGEVPFCHSSMIIGYDKDEKVLKQVDYGQNGAITILDIPFEDFQNAFFSDALEEIFKNEKGKDIKYLITLYRLKQNENVKLNPEVMKIWIKDFIDCFPSNKRTDYFIQVGNTLGGFAVYPAVIEMSQTLFEVNQGSIDYRMFHCIYEHKRLMELRIQELERQKLLDPALNLFDMNHKILKIAESMRFTILKNNLVPQKENLSQIKESMAKLESLEHETMNLLLNNL